MQKFKKGDRVRVREWNDMVKEFEHDAVPETNDFEYIHTPFGFTNNMRHLCGETGVVDMVEEIEVFIPGSSELAYDATGKEQKLRIIWDNPNIDISIIRDNPNVNLSYDFDNGMFELIN